MEEKWLRGKCAEFLRRAESAESQLAALREEFEQFKRHWAEDDRDITALSEENESLKKELAETVQSAEANIRAEVADGGKSCHWCLDKTTLAERKRIIEIIESIPTTISVYLTIPEAKAATALKETIVKAITGAESA